MFKKFISFSQAIDSFCRNHCVLSISLMVTFGILLIALQCLIYYFCHSYFLVVSGWSIAFVILLCILCIAICSVNSYISWHKERKIGLKQTVNLKHLEK